MFDSEGIHNVSCVYILYVCQEDSEVSDTVFVSRLRLGSVKESHYGEFLCRATNSLGAGTVHRVQLLRWYYVINR